MDEGEARGSEGRSSVNSGELCGGETRCKRTYLVGGVLKKVCWRIHHCKETDRKTNLIDVAHFFALRFKLLRVHIHVFFHNSAENIKLGI